MNEENRISFIKFHFEKFSQVLSEQAQSGLELVERMNHSIEKINAEDDINSFNVRFNYTYVNHTRIPKEEFINYDIYRRNLEKVMAANSLALENSSDASTEQGSVNQPEDREKLIDNFFKEIRTREDEISIEDLGMLMENLYNNMPFCKLLIDRFLIVYKSCLSVNIPNYQNFHHLGNILLTMINSLDVKSEYFEMNFAIIYISEKTHYINPDNNINKIYLCSVISKNKFLADKVYWINLIEIKINSMTENRLNKEYNKDKNKIENNIFSMTKMKNMLTGKKQDLREIVPPHIYEFVKTSEATSVLREYIPHFANFNIDVSMAIDIIVDLSVKYSFHKDKVSYFISILNSNLFTIKNKSLSEKIDIEKIFFNKEYKKYQKLIDPIITTFAFSMKYLPTQDCLNTLLLNKTYNRKLVKILYKNLLFKYNSMDMMTRLLFWKNILRIVNYVYLEST